MNDRKQRARPDPRQANRAHYDRPEVREAYARDEGLSASEERLVERFLSPGDSVLDLGSGAGRVALALEELGRRATGLDASDGMIETARARAARSGAAVEFVAGDATELPFERDSFDAVIFACNGIGHLDLEGKRRCLAELKRVVRPGGAVILSFRSPYALNRLLVPFLLRAPGAPDQDAAWEGEVYVHRPSARTMRRLVEEAGLELVCETSQLALRRGFRLGPLTPYLGGQFFLVARA